LLVVASRFLTKYFSRIQCLQLIINGKPMSTFFINGTFPGNPIGGGVRITIMF